MWMMPNYDKPWRCPNWSGPGFKAGGGPCPGGSTAAQWGQGGRRDDHRKSFRCPECHTLILPFVLRKLDPSWYWGHYAWRIRSWLRDKLS